MESRIGDRIRAGSQSVGNCESKPGNDLKALWLAEFKRWLVEDGKDYRIQKFVPKAK